MYSDFSLDFDSRTYGLEPVITPLAQKLPLYITSIGHYFAREKYFTERAGYSNYILFLTLSGRGYFKTKNTEFYLNKNQLILLNCNDDTLYKTACDDVWEFKFIHFEGSSAKEYHDIINAGGVSPVMLDKYSDIQSRISDIFKTCEKEHFLPDVKICSEMVGLISSIILEKNASDDNIKRHQNAVTCAIEYIKENFYQNIKVSEISKIVNFSEYYFIKTFKNYTGTTPHEYLSNYRITTAKLLLSTTDLTVTDIAVKVGFSDANGFIKSFKKIMGTTPLKYRNHFVRN